MADRDFSSTNSVGLGFSVMAQDIWSRCNCHMSYRSLGTVLCTVGGISPGWDGGIDAVAC